MNKRGFTLIELLIVIAIIAILAGAMAPMFLGAQRRAQAARAQTDLQAIKTASIMYHHDMADWPDSASSGSEQAALVTGVGMDPDDWDGPYLEEWTDDPWDNAYQFNEYTLSGNTALRARSRGPDEDFGTDDDFEVLVTPDITI